jgi:hypothetical protein
VLVSDEREPDDPDVLVDGLVVRPSALVDPVGSGRSGGLMAQQHRHPARSTRAQ